MATALEKKISSVMRPIHERILRQLPITLGTLIGAGLEIAAYVTNETLDDNNILHGEDADRFFENMIKQKTEGPSKFQKKMIEEIKRDKKFFVVEDTTSKTK